MDVEQRVTRRNAKRLGNAQRIRPFFSEQFLQVLVVIFHHVFRKIGNFVWKFRASEIEDEGTRDDSHFDHMDRFDGLNQSWHVVSGDLVDISVTKPLVNFAFALETIGTIEELDGMPV